MPTSASRLLHFEEILTLLIGVLVLMAAGAGLFIPGFYTRVVDPRYATGTLTADLVALICVPLLAMCVGQARRGSSVARLTWVALVAYLGYMYATYAFDRMYTVLFPLYMALFGLSSFVIVALLVQVQPQRLAPLAQAMPLRRTTAGFLVLTGLILYAIELPLILSRIPSGIQAGGTPFMVLDMSLVAPISILTGIWLWQRRPWGMALTAIFLVKAITLMSSFLIADYIDWFAGRLTTQPVTLAFTGVFLLACFFAWNYFAAFGRLSAPAASR